MLIINRSTYNASGFMQHYIDWVVVPKHSVLTVKVNLYLRKLANKLLAVVTHLLI
jgi:hypothetical protein